MATFVLLIILVNPSSADQIDFDGCTEKGSWSGSGGGKYGTDGCPYSNLCHRLNGNGSTTAGQIERRFDTTGYSDIYAIFDIHTTGYGSSEFCWVLYSIDDGANWIEINKYSSENDGENRYIYFPPSVNDNYNFKIKFQSAANDAAEYCYVDGIGVYGTSPKNIPYDSSIRIFQDYATSTTDAAWTWSGYNNQGGVHYNCLGYIGCDTCACFQIKGGSNPGSIEKLISTAGYIHISVEFDIRSTGIDANEHCIAWYTDNGGTNWYQIGSLDFTNDGKRYYFLPESCSDNNQFGLRFTIQASWISEVCYIDIIRVNGDLPTPSPTDSPTNPTIHPTSAPTSYPTPSPTNNPSTSPTTATPTAIPTFLPSDSPSYHPSLYPSTDPTYVPTQYPSTDPSIDPTIDPTVDPTHDPSADPTNMPTRNPSYFPTKYPSNDPTIDPTPDPTVEPTYIPTMNPTFTYNPTTFPTKTPSKIPTISPTSATKGPTSITMSPSQPNGQVSEKTTITITKNENNDNEDVDNNKQQSLNININIHITVVIIIILAVCMVLICCVIFVCFKKRKHKAEETKFVHSSSTTDTVMEMNKSDDKMDKIQEKTEINAMDLVRVASISSIASIDLLRVQQQQQQTLDNITMEGTPTDDNMVDDDDEEEGSSMYRMDLQDNDDDDDDHDEHHNNDNDDDDGINYDDMYGENDKITKGNDSASPTKIVMVIESRQNQTKK